MDLSPPDLLLDDLDYSIPDGDRQRWDLGLPADAGVYALPDCTGVMTFPARDLFTTLIQPRCTDGGCHRGAGSGATVFAIATAAEMTAAWVNAISQQSYKRRVVPGDPGHSYLVDKVLGKHGPPPAGVGSGTGGRMPLGCTPGANGTCLSEDEACQIINWIAAGAS